MESSYYFRFWFHGWKVVGTTTAAAAAAGRMTTPPMLYYYVRTTNSFLRIIPQRRRVGRQLIVSFFPYVLITKKLHIYLALQALTLSIAASAEDKQQK